MVSTQRSPSLYTRETRYGPWLLSLLGELPNIRNHKKGDSLSHAELWLRACSLLLNPSKKSRSIEMFGTWASARREKPEADGL